MNKKIIYADHAATTPLSSAAREAMRPYMEHDYGNPSALYSLARQSRRAVQRARQLISEVINVKPEELFFTSGGSEADNWALLGTMLHPEQTKKHIIISAIEHHAILNTCAYLQRIGVSVTLLQPEEKGIITAESLQNAMTDETALVSVMLANNEIGTIEPIKELADVAHSKGALFHTDAVQAVGHIPIDVEQLGVDMLSASAHKFNGPKGVGFLYVRRGTVIEPLIHGGMQEYGYRAGTENVAGIVGMAAALHEHAESLNKEIAYLNTLQERLVRALNEANVDFVVNGDPYRIPGSLSLSFRNVEGEMLLHRLDLQGVMVATGSACDSKNTVVSHVIQAIGLASEYAKGTIRITLGMDNDDDQVDQIVNSIVSIVNL